MSTAILVVDDDEHLRALIALTLEEVGHRVFQAGDGPQALEAYHAHQPDLVVLDIGLGAMDGLEVCRRIRSFSDVPVLFLTSRAEEVDELVGFAVGGDDYVTKPFSPRVLAARVGTVLRRHGVGAQDRSIFEAGALRLDADARTCTYDGHLLELTRIEFDILAALMAHPKQVMTREALVEEVWGTWFGDTRLLESHISRLRRKVREGGGPPVVVAVRGVGYKLAGPDGPAVS